MKMPFIEELESDLRLLYDNLEGVPTFAESGGVTAIGERAFPVAVGRTTPVVAAARYGEGRIAAAGHEAYFSRFASGDEPDPFTRNMFRWLTNEKAGPLPEPVRIVNWEAERPVPERVPLVQIDGSLSDIDLPYVDAYIQGGGAAIVALKGWELEENPPPSGAPLKIREFPLQKLLNKAGLGLLGNVSVWNAGASLPMPSVDTATHAHALFLLHQARLVESGALTIEQLPVGPPLAAVKQKTEAVTAILSRTIEALTDVSPLNGQLQDEVRQLAEIGLPLDRSSMPYTGALLVQRFKQATLHPDGGKSPYADLFPGKVEAEAPLVNGREVCVNFDYADLSYLRTLYAPENWQSTGLYAPAGQTIEIAVPEGAEHLDVQIGSHTDTLFHLPKWDRAPLIALRQKLEPGTNLLSSPYGGLIYFIPKQRKAEASLTVTISGAVQAPYFVSGQTSDEEWSRSLRNAPAPVAELQGKRIVLTVPSDAVRSLGSPQDLMNNWDAMVDAFDELAGLAPDKPLPHRSPDRPHRIVADTQISAGYMHAGYPIMIPIEPAGRDAVDFAKVRNVKSGWGFWHELGHNYQQVPWFWDMIVEVTVNLHSLNMQDRYGNRPRLFSANKEGRTHYDVAFDFMQSPDNGKRFEHIDFFERLVMIRQLQLAYGWDFYTRLHIAYRELPEEQLPRTDQQKLDLLVVMMCRTSGENLSVFFDKWGWNYTEDARSQVAALGLPEPQTDIWMLKESAEFILAEI
ncbi:M60 family metallopeptidase [Paenibacillus sp. MBLB4367]|uniref:M60 family metallopeptidase n=1 Tax=Paenibacillus sp. MBLB4367 TaxID=3384767 RepID=UPI0039081BBD